MSPPLNALDRAAPGNVARAPRWSPVVFLVALVLLFAAARDPGISPAAPSRGAALAEALGHRGLLTSPEDVLWIDPPRGVGAALVGTSRALVRATTRDEPADLYLVRTRLSPEGVLLEVCDVYNVTRTSGVDEGRPLVDGHHVAYTTSFGDTVTAIHMLDLLGRTPTDYADFTELQRVQTELTNLQQTGQARGVVNDTFVLDPSAHDVTLRWEPTGLLTVQADGRVIELDPTTGLARRGAGWIRSLPEEKARPGNLVTWSVDRVRAMSWFGDTRMQWLKALVFTTLDLVLRARSHVVDTTASEVARDLGGSHDPAGPGAASDPELGWPPAPLTPILTPPLTGEGRWIVLEHDPFITPSPGLPPAFVTTFLRTDRERPDTRVYVTLWDPRQVALHMVAGTVEPVSASGEAGSGLIPRVPEVMRHLVAGFNGGFQAMHGEYGMQADGVEYLPPKPFAATVLELRDGSTAFGAWPDSPVVPDEVLSFRQNLTALVQGGRWNPWGRSWWGGTPPGWQDNIHTTRTGVCLTEDRAVGYFFGADLSAEALARGMLGAHCSFGVHLDMNPGLAGFEFYDVEETGAFRSLPRPLQPDWEYEGTIHDLPDLHVRARRMTRGMTEVNFPQYIHREARDFFYLTERPLLPGAAIPAVMPPAEGDEGAWRVKGLPQHGFPYAMATTTLRPDAEHPLTKVRILRVDPRTLRPAGTAGTNEDTPTVASFFSSDRGTVSLWWRDGIFLIGAGGDAGRGAHRVASGVPFSAASGARARVAVGVDDLDGMLQWVEIPAGADAGRTFLGAVDSLLARLGCSQRFVIEESAMALLGGSLDLSGTPMAAPAIASARFVRGSTPSAERYFEATPIVGPGVWQPLQSRRIRYFPKPPRPSPSSSSSAATPGAAPSGAP